MKEFQFQLTISTINVGSISNAASLNIGRNFLRDFKSMSKSNAGIGAISGSQHNFTSCQTYVQDPDGIDMCWESEPIKSATADQKKDSLPLGGRLEKI